MYAELFLSDSLLIVEHNEWVENFTILHKYFSILDDSWNSWSVWIRSIRWNHFLPHGHCLKEHGRGTFSYATYQIPDSMPFGNSK